MEQNSVQSLGNRLNELRLRNKMTYAQWAELSKIPEGTIKSILSGGTVNPGFETVCAMLLALNVSIDEFYSNARGAAKIICRDMTPEPAPEKQSYADLTRDMRAAARDAMEAVGRDELVKSMRNDRMFWRTLSILLVCIIVFWLQWDLRHPGAGIIQYGYVAPNSQTQEEDDTLKYGDTPLAEAIYIWDI